MGLMALSNELEYINTHQYSAKDTNADHYRGVTSPNKAQDVTLVPMATFTNIWESH